MQPTSDEMYRGVGRRLTIKDVARRSAMTRLSNAPDVGLMDVAAYFGVHKNTVSVYHKMGKSIPVKAAALLSRGSVGAPKSEA